MGNAVAPKAVPIYPDGSCAYSGSRKPNLWPSPEPDLV